MVQIPPLADQFNFKLSIWTICVNLILYFGLIDERIIHSEKEQPVLIFKGTYHVYAWFFNGRFRINFQEFFRDKLSQRFLLFKGQLISKANFEVFIWTKKWKKIFFYVFPSSLKNGSNQKRMQIIILDDKKSPISIKISHYFYDLTHFKG